LIVEETLEAILKGDGTAICRWIRYCNFEKTLVYILVIIWILLGAGVV
jgi:hypothetical protein